MGRLKDAEPLYRKSLEIWRKALGPEHPRVGTSLNNLASLLQNMGRLADAEPLYRETNPRNPRHFNIIEGGRKRVSTIFIDKNNFSGMH